jgi:uncharacterized membrane protein YozB (DUF420 family)
MDGFLGTDASMWSDVTLVFTCALGAAAVFGGIRAHQKRFSTHCPVMATAVFLTWIPVVLVMSPVWFEALTGDSPAPAPFALVPVFHGILGGVTQLLMTYTVIRMYWLEQLPPEHPIWLMRVTLTLWLLTVVGGTVVYVVQYIT